MTLAVGVGGPGELDVVAEARAAFQPHDQILHTVLIERSASYDGSGRRVEETSGVQEYTRVEQWLMTDPPRWRAVFTRVPKSTPGARALARAGAFEPLEVAYGDGVSSSWEHSRGVARVTSGFSDRGEAAKAVGFGSAQRLRSVDDVRNLLSSGRLRDAGPAEVGGREVRMLVQTGGRDAEGRITDLAVDPKTYAPVRISSSWKPFLRSPADFEGRELETRSVVDFQVYERLPDTSANPRKLTISPPASVRLWTRTVEQVRAERRARERARELRLARAKRD